MIVSNILIEAFRLALRLNYIKAQYTNGDCNSIADKLAKLAKDWDIKVWIAEAPSCIKDILASKAHS